ncbi:MAG TPA: universal stress protein [Chloroflexota bacterium]|nr:universal stress protein [Chloroflexota bacterium]
MFHRIVVPLDGSSLAEAILPEVQRLAADSPLEVVLLAVGPVPQGIEERDGQVAYLDDLLAEQEQDLRDYLRGPAHWLNSHRIPVEMRVRFGDPAAEIVRCAEDEEADAIAMCTHGRTGLDRLIHGSVAGAVLRSTRLPIILCHPTDGAFAGQHADEAKRLTLV